MSLIRILITVKHIVCVILLNRFFVMLQEIILLLPADNFSRFSYVFIVIEKTHFVSI